MPQGANEAGGLSRALNWGHCRLQIFWKGEDHVVFERVLAAGVVDKDVSLYLFQLMANHWHLVLHPNVDDEKSRFLRWVTATHTIRYHSRDCASGEAHADQGRDESFPIQDLDYFLTASRSVSRSALRAEFVSRAEEWDWGSPWRWSQAPESRPDLRSSARVNEHSSVGH